MSVELSLLIESSSSSSSIVAVCGGSGQKNYWSLSSFYLIISYSYTARLEFVQCVPACSVYIYWNRHPFSYSLSKCGLKPRSVLSVMVPCTLPLTPCSLLPGLQSTLTKHYCYYCCCCNHRRQPRHQPQNKHTHALEFTYRRRIYILFSVVLILGPVFFFSWTPPIANICTTTTYIHLHSSRLIVILTIIIVQISEAVMRSYKTPPQGVCIGSKTTTSRDD